MNKSETELTPLGGERTDSEKTEATNEEQLLSSLVIRIEMHV